MYLPRSLLSKLYVHLQRSRHPHSPPVLILVALEPDALCACRILTRLLKHDYIQHKIQPIAGYSDLEKAGTDLVAPMMTTHGGSGNVVVCLGVGGMADMGSILALEPEDPQEPAYNGVEVWLVDSHRPWNLSNVFGGFPADLEPEGPPGSVPLPGVDAGRITHLYRPGAGGIIAFDDGDIEDQLAEEGAAYTALLGMPEVDETEDLGDSDEDEDDSDADGDATMANGSAHAGTKRKSSDVLFSDDDSDADAPPKQRRRSNDSTGIAVERPKGRGLMVAGSNSLVVPGSSFNIAALASGTTAVRGASARALKRRLLRMRDANESIIRKYYQLGTSFSDPISSTMYALASELGRDDNDLLWFCIVGVSSAEIYGRSSAGIAAPVRSTDSVVSGWLGKRGARIRQVLRDEVRRLNPPDVIPGGGSGAAVEDRGMILTTARSPDDYGIRLSPEPRFLLVRHWSLFDSMLHSPYLFSRLHTWSDAGVDRLKKLITKMGISQVQAKQHYVHMDPTLKRELRPKLTKYAGIYNLEEMIPPLETDGKDKEGAKDAWGFVRSWGWKATLSAQDVVVVIGALLEIGKDGAARERPYYATGQEEDIDGEERKDEWISRFWGAYDALEDVDVLKTAIPTAMHLHRAIFRTGKTLINKKQIKHLRAFRLCILRDGVDLDLFTHPAALTKLALWIGEALVDQEQFSKGKLSQAGRGTPLVAAGLDEKRGVYTVVGLGGGGGPDTVFVNKEVARKKREAREKKARVREAKRATKRRKKEREREEKRAKKAAEKKERGGDEDEDEDDEDDDEEEEDEEDYDSSESESESEDDESGKKGYGLNKFGAAFQEVIAETNARVKVDSFEHCVVEVKKEDLGGFLEALSMKTVVG